MNWRMGKHLGSGKMKPDGILLFVLYGLYITLVSTAFGREIAKNAEIGAIEAWHIEDFLAAYRDSRHVYFRIRDHGQVLLWDADRHIFVPWSDSFLAKLERANSFLDGVESLQLDSHTTAKITGDFSRFATSFSQYIIVYDDNTVTGEFYMVGAAGDDHVQQRFCCDSLDPVETLAVKYDLLPFLEVDKLESGDLIFFCVTGHLGSIYAIKLPRGPTQNTSVNNTIFLFPRADLAGKLAQSGQKLNGRYQVIQDAMLHSQNVRNSTLGKLVTTEVMFPK